MTILSGVDWKSVSALVEKEQYNRELHSPVVSSFRWWARRPHRVMASIIESAISVYGRNHLTVSDPFSGGGTVTFEAYRQGLPVYAQDLYPWPSFCLSSALQTVDPQDFAKSSQEVLKSLAHLRTAYRFTRDGETVELTHILRVRTGCCPGCRHRVYLFPGALVSLVSRRQGEQGAFLACRACGHVHRGWRSSRHFKCPLCASSTPLNPEKQKGSFQCPHCSRLVKIQDALTNPPAWHPFLVQEIRPEAKRPQALVRTIQEGDPTTDTCAAGGVEALKRPIEQGVETDRLSNAGFAHWGDVYTHRQTKTIAGALEAIRGLDALPGMKDRLAMAVIGASEMAGYLCRWDRFHPKAIEALANHRYAHTTVAVETNLLSPVGRGTIPRRMVAARRALDWVMDVGRQDTRVTQTSSAGERRKIGREAVVATGSSVRQLPMDGSVKLVLTDPPYYDDVQYGELSRLFHLWLGQYLELSPPAEALEAVPNRHRRVTGEDYEQRISQCLSECRRTLAPDGTLILTYHNRKFRAWQALCNALINAGFTVSGLAVVRAENSADHTKRREGSILHDLVVECAPSSSGKHSHDLATGTDLPTDVERELLAMGQALARSVNAQDGSSLRDFYEAATQTLRLNERPA